MTEMNRKERVGTVVSDKMQKTVVVVVEWRQKHRLYQKSMKRISRFVVHDEHNECSIGDRVRIMEVRPLSKNKRWKLAEILQRRDVPEVKPTQIGTPEDTPREE